jgi:hypothetical protein
MAVVAASPNSAKGRLPGEWGSGLRAAAAKEASGSSVEELEADFGKLAEVADDSAVFAGERLAALCVLPIWVGHRNAPFQPQDFAP